MPLIFFPILVVYIKEEPYEEVTAKLQPNLNNFVVAHVQDTCNVKEEIEGNETQTIDIKEELLFNDLVSIFFTNILKYQ